MMHEKQYNIWHIVNVQYIVVIIVRPGDPTSGIVPSTNGLARP